MIPGPFFPRGNGPLVSVVMTTRSRPTHLVSALDSIINLAADKSHIEIVLKLDDDDKPTHEAVASWKANHPSIVVKTPITPQWRGYAEMGRWANLMAGEAAGDWLLSFNDDAHMLTEKWDLYLMGAVLPNCWHFVPEDITLLVPETNNQPDSTEFLAIRRSQVDLLGGRLVSDGCCYVDSWLTAMVGRLYSQVRFPLIKIRHYRDTVRDEIRSSTDAAFQANLSTLEGTSAILGQVSDSLRLLQHIESKFLSVVAQSGPTSPGWYYWKPEPTYAAHHLVVCEDGRALWYQDNFLGGRCLAFDPKQLGGLWWPRLVHEGKG